MPLNIVWSNDMEHCENKLAISLHNLFTESIRDPKSAKVISELYKTRAETALMRSALTFYKLREKDYQQGGEVVKRLQNEINSNLAGSGKVALKQDLEEYLKLIANNERNIDGKYDDKIKDLEVFIKTPSQVLFKSSPQYQINDVDLMFLNKALVTFRKGNPSLLSYTLDQIKTHMPQRSFDDDESAMKYATAKSIGRFRDQLAKELSDYLPEALDQIRDKCENYVQTLEENSQCQIMSGILSNHLSKFEKVLNYIDEDLKLTKNNLVYLKVAMPKTEVNCKFTKENGKINLNLNMNLRNFEGTDNSYWSLNSTIPGHENYSIQNPERKNSTNLEKEISFNSIEDIQKHANFEFKRTPQIYAVPAININGTKKIRSSKFNITECEGYAELSGQSPPPAPVLKAEPKEEKQEEPKLVEKLAVNSTPVVVTPVVKPAPTPKPTTPSKPEVPKEPEAPKDPPKKQGLRVPYEKEDLGPSIQITLKTKHECVYNKCESKERSDKKKSCEDIEVGKEAKNTFDKDKEKSYKVHLYCRKKGSKDEFKPLLSRSGKQKSIKIDKCKDNECEKAKDLDFKMPVIAPMPTQLQAPTLNLIEAPMLLEM